jgi:hypothetical protein
MALRIEGDVNVLEITLVAILIWQILQGEVVECPEVPVLDDERVPPISNVVEN